MITYNSILNSGYYEGELYVDSNSVSYDLQEMQVHYKRASVSIINCGDENWNCSSYGYFNFATNKDWENLPEKWEYGNFKYENIGSSKISILGFEGNIETISITSKVNDKNFQVLMYSKEHGLIAFRSYVYEKDIDETVENLFLLSGKRGLNLL